MNIYTYIFTQMILQLTNGRFIEISVEQYLNMTDEDIQYLVSLGNSHTKDSSNPFYGSLTDNPSENEDEEENSKDFYDSD